MHLQMTLSPDDLASAPQDVREWLYHRAGMLENTMACTSSDPALLDPTLQDAISAAGEFLKSHSLDSLAEILNAMGLNRVSECPREHIPELMSRMAEA